MLSFIISIASQISVLSQSKVLYEYNNVGYSITNPANVKFCVSADNIRDASPLFGQRPLHY